jgi:pimeloyl-ACP methyl ester carboxylesterase
MPMRRSWLFSVVLILTLLGARPAEAGWRDWVSPSQNWQRVKNGCYWATTPVRNYCRHKVERAKADQEKTWGLFLPADVDARRPIVVCIHGLDSTAGVFGKLEPLLEKQGYQVAYFSYPSDGPIAGSADRLADELDALRETFPGMRVHVIGHSMGALVARAYIEGDRYAVPVGHFIAIAPPNHGSPWTRERFLLEFNEQYWLWRSNPQWSPVWMFTDGHGEAADDLKPDSEFLKALNAGPRRDGVHYTIVMGDHHVLNRFYANGLATMESCTPKRHWWGLRQTVACMAATERMLLDAVSDTDGVVPMESARLAGVEDVVRLHGDHNTLVMGSRGKEPVAWGVIRERLAVK